jgi:hypothetical protein
MRDACLDSMPWCASSGRVSRSLKLSFEECLGACFSGHGVSIPIQNQKVQSTSEYTEGGGSQSRVSLDDPRRCSALRTRGCNRCYDEALCSHQMLGSCSVHRGDALSHSRRRCRSPDSESPSSWDHREVEAAARLLLLHQQNSRRRRRESTRAWFMERRSVVICVSRTVAGQGFYEVSC